MARFEHRGEMLSNAVAASPLDIERAIISCHNELEDAVDLLKSFGQDAARKKAAYERGHAKYMLMARTQADATSAPDRKAWADEQAGDLRMDSLVADALHSSQKAVIDVLQTQNMGLMALLRSVRGALGEG